MKGTAIVPFHTMTNTHTHANAHTTANATPLTSGNTTDSRIACTLTHGSLTHERHHHHHQPHYRYRTTTRHHSRRHGLLLHPQLPS